MIPGLPVSCCLCGLLFDCFVFLLFECFGFGFGLIVFVVCCYLSFLGLRLFCFDMVCGLCCFVCLDLLVCWCSLGWGLFLFILLGFMAYV